MPEEEFRIIEKFEELLSREPNLDFDSLVSRLNATEDEIELLRMAYRLRTMGSAKLPSISISREELLSRTPKLEPQPGWKPWKWPRIMQYGVVAVIVAAMIFIFPHIGSPPAYAGLTIHLWSGEFEDLEGVIVNLSELNPPHSQFEGMTIQAGMLVFEGVLDPGEYIIEISDPRFLKTTARISMYADGTYSIPEDMQEEGFGNYSVFNEKIVTLPVFSKAKYQLKEGTGGIAGFVQTNLPGHQAKKLMVYVAQTSSDEADEIYSHTGQIRDNGSFFIGDIPPGKYEVKIAFYIEAYAIKIIHSGTISTDENTVRVYNIDLTGYDANLLKSRNAKYFHKFRRGGNVVAGLNAQNYTTTGEYTEWLFVTDHAISVFGYILDDSLDIFGENAEVGGLYPYDFDNDGWKELFIGDEVDEFFGLPPSGDPRNYGNVYLVDQDGSLLWRFTTGKLSEYTYPITEYLSSGEHIQREVAVDTRYSIRIIRAVEASERPGKEVFVASFHGYGPSRFVLLDNKGAMISDFFHYGHIHSRVDGTRPYFGDIDSDGKDEIIAIAFCSYLRDAETELGPAAIFCLDLNEMGGYAPSHFNNAPKHTKPSGLKWYSIIDGSFGNAGVMPSDFEVYVGDKGNWEITCSLTGWGARSGYDVTIDALTGEGEGVSRVWFNGKPEPYEPPN